MPCRVTPPLGARGPVCGSEHWELHQGLRRVPLLFERSLHADVSSLAWNRRALHRTPGNMDPVAGSRLTHPRRQAPLQGAGVHTLQDDLDTHWGA